MHSLKTYTVLFLINLALAALSASASSALVTEYIAPCTNATWSGRVYPGEYATGEGIEFSKVQDTTGAYCNYKIDIDGKPFGIFDSWCEDFWGDGRFLYPDTILRSVLTPGSESMRYLYPLTYVENEGYDVDNKTQRIICDSDVDDSFIVNNSLDTDSDGAEYVQCVHTDWVYKVTFDANGGTGIMLSQTYTNSADLVANSFTREGYTFDGWYSGSTTYKDKAKVSGLDLTLYAQWKPIRYTVTVTSGGHGTVSPSGTFNYDYGSIVTNSASASTGYHFVRWKDAADKAITTDNPYCFTVTSAVTNIAEFAANIYTICYDPNSKDHVEGRVDSQVNVEYGKSIQLQKGTFTRDGYEFKGWSLVAGSNDANFDESRSYEVSALVGELAHDQTLMLYAAWRPTSYTIFLDNCNGENKNKAYLYYDEMYYDLTNSIPVKVGYSFSGYYDANNKLWFDGEGVPCTPWDGTVDTLYAHWKPIEYIVQFDTNAVDASGSMDTMALTYDMPTNLTSNAFLRDKWLFDGWTNTEAHVRYEDGAVVSNLTAQADSSVTLHALWRRDTFNLALHNGDATSYLFVTNGFEYGSLSIPTNSSLAEFAGWWTSEDLSDARQVFNSSLVDKSMATNLYARWKPIIDHKKGTVSFSADGAISKPDPVTLVVGSKFGTLPVASYEGGYELLGWYLDGKRVTPETIVPSNVTLVARKTLKAFNDAWGCDDIAFSTSANSGWSIDGSTKIAQSATTGGGNDIVESSLEFLTDEDGTLSFDWFAACRPKDSNMAMAYLEFDGGDYIAGSKEYETKGGLSIKGGKTYSLKYCRYVERESSDGEDCGRVKNFVWKPTSKASAIDEWVSFASITSSVADAAFAAGGNAQWRTLDDTSVVAVTNLEDSGVAWLELSLSGPGELCFDWRVSSEPGFVDTNGVEQICDYLEFLFDGGPVSEVHGLDMFGYTPVVFTNVSSGVHKYRWRYAKDDSAKAGKDSAYLKNLSWTPFTTEVEYDDPHGGDKKVVLSVPNSWVDKYSLLSAAKTTSYGAALSAYSGKKGPGGADLPYWYDYVAGTDPTNTASLFKIKSVSVVGDSVSIEWDPDLSEETGELKRVYTIWGKTNLTDAAWHTPTNSASRFFKVEVSLPE